jgi:hypothetical protein
MLFLETFDESHVHALPYIVSIHRSIEVANGFARQRWMEWPLRQVPSGTWIAMQGKRQKGRYSARGLLRRKECSIKVVERQQLA